MISKMKVSDGDLIIVNIGSTDISQKHIEFMRDRLRKWAAAKGLNNVEFVVTAGSDMSLTQLTVNDVFENEVLKGDK